MREIRARSSGHFNDEFVVRAYVLRLKYRANINRFHDGKDTIVWQDEDV